MKILFLLDSLTPGGTETSTVALARGLIQRGHEPTIATLRLEEHGLEESARAGGIELIRLRSPKFVNQVFELRRILQSRDFDVLHTALFKSDQVGRLASTGMRLPVVSSFVNTPYEEARICGEKVKRWRVRTLQTLDALTAHLLVDHFHSVSLGAKKSNARALRLPLDRITVAERGRDPRQLGEYSAIRRSRTRLALGLDDRDELVINVGRMDQQKAQTVFVQALDQLASRRPRVTGAIAGKSGSAVNDVEDAIRQSSHCRDRTRLLGHRTDIADLLCASDVLVISSHFEGTAGVAVEAMAVSTPIVATNIAGVVGILEHDRNALLVPAGDANAIAAAVERLLDDRSLADHLSSNGARDFSERFTLDAATKRMIAIYREVTSS